MNSVWGMDLKRRVCGIPLVVHSLRGGLEKDLLFQRSRGILLNWNCGMNFLAGKELNYIKNFHLKYKFEKSNNILL